MADTYHEIICGDCLEVMRWLPDKSIDMVLSDLPYGVVNRCSGGLRVLDKGMADIETFTLDSVLSQLARVVKGSIYLFCTGGR